MLALTWTLLRQSPGGGGVPTTRRAVVVCPATLVANWKAEAAKWLGPERLGVLALSFRSRLTSGDNRRPKCSNLMSSQPL